MTFFYEINFKILGRALKIYLYFNYIKRYYILNILILCCVQAQMITV